MATNWTRTLLVKLCDITWDGRLLNSRSFRDDALFRSGTTKEMFYLMMHSMHFIYS